MESAISSSNLAETRTIHHCIPLEVSLLVMSSSYCNPGFGDPPFFFSVRRSSMTAFQEDPSSAFRCSRRSFFCFLRSLAEETEAEPEDEAGDESGRWKEDGSARARGRGRQRDPLKLPWPRQEEEEEGEEVEEDGGEEMGSKPWKCAGGEIISSPLLSSEEEEEEEEYGDGMQEEDISCHVMSYVMYVYYACLASNHKEGWRGSRGHRRCKSLRKRRVRSAPSDLDKKERAGKKVVRGRPTLSEVAQPL